MITNETLVKIYNAIPADKQDHYKPLIEADKRLTEEIRIHASAGGFAPLDEARNELDRCARESGFILGYLTALKHTENAAIKDDRSVILADIKSRAADLPEKALEVIQTVIKELEKED